MKCLELADYWKISQIFFAEFLAAGIANFYCFFVDKQDPNLPIVVGFLAGATVYIAIWCSFTTSGAQINPVVTLACLITRRMKPFLTPVYLIGDFVGTLVGMAMAWSVSPFATQDSEDYGMTLPGVGISNLAATMTEAGTTFLLITVILASFDELRAKEWRVEQGAPFSFAVMLTLVVNVATTVRISGASMNPIRSLAAAIIQNNYDRLWIYFAGPILGCLMACFFYELVICPLASLNRTQHYLCSRSFDRKVTYKSSEASEARL
ncbi:hypothetical protein Aperf_G00000101901 [Anoplocephala perfoliata]